MSSQTTTGATPAATNPLEQAPSLSSSFTTAVSSFSSSSLPSSSTISRHHHGQPVPPAMTTGLVEWPQDASADANSTSSSASGGHGKLWLLALLPLFLLVVVAVYVAAVRIRMRAKRRGNLRAARGTTDEAGPGAEDVDVESGAAIKRVVGMDGVVSKGADERDDDERTLVGRDEVMVVKVQEKAKGQGDAAEGDS